MRSAVSLAMRNETVPNWIQFDPGDEDDGGGSGEEISHESGNGEMANRMAALEEANKSNAALSALMADPEVRKVIEAKRAGKKLAITEEAENPEPEIEDPLKDIKDDDPLKATLTRINELIDKKNEALMQKLGVDKLSERVAGVENLATKIQTKEVVDQVKAVKAKYKDFEEYKTQILDLSKAQPGLNVEQLYILSKLSSGKLKISEPTTFSEKPSSQPSRRPGAEGKPKTPARAPGRKGFHQVLADALSGMSLEETE